MSLQLIYGLGGSGKSEYLLKIAEKTWKESDKKVFFIVPEQYSYETEKALAGRLGVISPKTVEVLSFKRLFHYVCGNVGGALLPKISDTGKKILIAKTSENCLKDLKVLGKSAKYSGFSDILVTLFAEFKRYNTTPEKLKAVNEKIEEDFLRYKMEDIALLYEGYEKALAGSFTDPEDELTLLSGILAEHRDFFSESIVLIDQFEGFTPQELGVIGELCRGAEKVMITLCTDSLLPSDNGKNSIFSMQHKTVRALTEITQRYNILSEKPVYLNEDFKHSSNEPLKHLEKCLRTGSYEKYEGCPENVEILFALNLTAEMEQVAEKIISLTRDKGYRYRDFTVVSRDGETYGGVTENVFKRYGIPVYVGNKNPLAEETPAYALLCALDIFLKKWDYNSVFSYLKTGYANVTDKECDLLENYIIKTGIRGTAWTNEKAWKYTPKGYNEKKLEKIEEIRSKVVKPLKEFEEKLRQAENVRDYIVATVEFMQQQQYSAKIRSTVEFYGTGNEAKRYEQIYNLIISAFNDIDSVCPSKEKISTEQFYSMLKTAFEAYKVGLIPTSVDSVTYADAERCRAAKTRIMFVVGVNDGVFPCVYMNEGVIRDDERRALETLGLKMAPDTLTRTFDEDFIVYATVTHPSEKIYFSYPMADNSGGSLSPSGFIRKIKTIFPDIKETESVISSEDILESVVSKETALDKLAHAKSLEREGEEISVVWTEVENQLKQDEEFSEKVKTIEKTFEFYNTSEKLTDEVLEVLYGDTVYTSVSKLETYRKCPFMYYAKYILGAEQREDTEFQSVDTGTVMHSVIEKLSLRVKNEFGSWSSVSHQWIEENVCEIADEEISALKNSIENVQPRQLWALYRIKQAVQLSALAVARQLQSGEFIPLGYEISFDDKSKYGCVEIPVNGKNVKLVGKIDRGDIYTNPQGERFIRIIDYKSGRREFKIENLYHGMNLQLAVYLDSLTGQENAKCAGMLYFRLFDPVASVEGDMNVEDAAKVVEKERKSSGLLVADTEIVKKMDCALEKGEDSYLPVKLKKDGDFDTRSSKIASYDRFEAMNKYVRKTVAEMSRLMLSGDTDVAPYKLDKETPCTYCEYKKMCHFDTAHGNKYKYLEKITADEAWEIIEKEGETND